MTHRVARHRRAGAPTGAACAAGGRRPQRQVGTYSWNLLIPVPLLAALAGVAAATVLTLAGLLSTMHATTATLVRMTSESHEAEHVWFALAQEQIAAAEVLDAPAGDAGVRRDVARATASARRRVAALGTYALSPEERSTYDRLHRNEDRALALQAALLRDGTGGDRAAARAVWTELAPTLGQAEASAHVLVHLVFESFPRRVSTVTAAAIDEHRRLLLWAFALVAAEFALISVWAGRMVGRPLARFTAAAAAVRDGDLAHRLPSFRIREFASLAESFNAMAASLGRMRVRERKLHRQALALREQRARLAQDRLALAIQAQEDERRRVARDLHDETAQALTAVHFSLERLAHDVPPQARPEMARTARLVRDIMASVRNMALDLHPHTLIELGLVPALQDLLNRLAGHVPFDLVFDADPAVPRLPAPVETAVFRIAQEALTNASRHARTARTARVGLHLSGGALVLTVADDGAGFTPAAPHARRTLGLFSMRERARQVGGRLSVSSSPSTGTLVQLTLPLPPPETGPAAVADGGESVGDHDRAG